MSFKTPVTILQELMIRKQEDLTYNLIFNQVGTHEPLFKYQVTGLGLSAIGSGKSKREAKHGAARLLLLMLKDKMDIPDLKKNPILQEVDFCYSPYDDTIKDNAVGALQTFCCEFQLQNPKYDLILDVGPPHFKLFTIKCTVSSFTQEATARTKKQAKHRCSAGMLQKLKFYLSDYIDCADGNDIMTVSCELAKRTVCLGHAISDLHNVFIKSTNFSPSSILEQLKTNQINIKNIFEPLEKLREICDEINFELDTMELPSGQKDIVVVNVFLIAKPGWSFIASDDNYDKAVNSAAVDAIEFLMEMMLGSE